jgi:hypothetical protein
VSTKDETQTCPSIEDDAIYIWLDDMLGTEGWCGVRGDAVRPPWAGGCLEGVSDLSVALLGEWVCGAGREITGGDTERAVTEADLWALYVRRGWKEGRLRACYSSQHTEAGKLSKALGATHDVAIVRAYNL